MPFLRKLFSNYSMWTIEVHGILLTDCPQEEGWFEN